MFFRKVVSILVASTMLLTGCAVGTGGSSNVKVGPQASSSYVKQAVEEEVVVAERPKLDIIIPVFDPGLPEDPKDYKDEGIWPELRRAETSRFAYKLKSAIEETGVFGAVRVMPDTTATGDLYVVGKINESNGEEVDINIKVYDISGKQWFDKSFDHEVEEEFYINARNKGKDPYDPVFQQAAERLVEELDDVKDKDLSQLQALTDLRFGANFSEEAFSQYMKSDGDTVSLVGYPDEGDNMLKRVKSIRIRDQLFTDRMQPHYEQFSRKMDDSYLLWQKQSFDEISAAREARNAAIGKAAAGVGLIALSVLAALAGASSNNVGGAVGGATAATVAGAVGAGMLSESSTMSQESKFHKDALDELGQSIDGEMAPQVIEFDETTTKLTGSAKEQFAEWRAFLKSLYEQELTPDVQL